ncbi:NADPH-dependent 2,4-dienoyl-CoA reductase/sulfur reductase-like enzyme/rhodanese-related sulfurtransferase [Prescottella agglutinans]|uniref:NADPH-dependent 2,4-dienoyl-CoA reductase/sulfur reductase-like enzyme/rhodanese-related sulfurtransferase n=1 Tax=Prescottella agglutinans TaxID=1644129 RepID=A0ABT6M5X8_9NOCA|nr:NADPH-dependent 2,4-dienoyl-CoA reductase/sulfur reductase-like enzyme/rhodanese-related sulfurtransferase [Prescottella agglutinans]
MKVVIVGGVAGGMSAATRMRRLDESAEIVVFERGAHVSFANCGLPYYAGGVIEDRDELLLQTPESLGARFRLDVRVRSEVAAIDPAARTVTVHDLASGDTYVESYDELVLSTGASPIVPPLPGVERALVLRDVEDVDRLVEQMESAQMSSTPSAVIVGAGFIGVELAENLRHRGLDVTVVELADQVLAPLDPEMAAPVADRMRENGVRLELGTQLTSIGADTAELADGRTVPADVVVMAIGVRPENALAKMIGADLGDRGGVVVDDQMRTSVPHVFAVGDAVEKRDAVGGGVAMIPLANPANRQGRLVADVIAGRPVRAKASSGTAVVGVFGLIVTATGWNEKRLRAAGRPYEAIHTHPQSHAGYYPGAQQMAIKLLVDPETDAILGAQAVGGEGVDKRIDIIATAMAGGLTASDLADLELAYAPQFGSAKDPVNMLGYIADNMRTGATRTVQWHELDTLVAGGASLVDVRTPDEFAAGAIPGAVNVPLDELRDRVGELPAGDLIVHCHVGQRGHTAVRLLAQLGRPAANLDGGYKTWDAGRHANVPAGVA